MELMDTMTCYGITTMTAGHSGHKDRTNSFIMRFDSSKNGWEIPGGGSYHPNMICGFHKFNLLTIDFDWVHGLGIVDCKGMIFR